MAHLRLAPQVRAPQGFRQARLTVSRQAEKRAAGETPAPKFSESVSAGLRVSRPDSEIDEASNGKAPLLTKPGLSKTVGFAN